MGEIAGTMTKKKKKKGRPSLLDLQKRSLKQQQLQQNPNLKNPNSLNAFPPTPHRRSTRRNPNPSSDENDEDEDDDDERKEKKHKLLLGLNSQQNNHFPYSYGDNPEVGFKRSKISAPRFGSDEMDEKPLKATNALHESPVEPGPMTPLPDKKLLVFILDRLQKKDTYGVFSDPVDPEELPDYHEIIENPMDFSTVRKKLDGGAYANLELFENDVVLVCSNAMQYNSPDTIYFRQARSMLELAKRDFDNLRQDSDSEPQPKIVRRGRPPGKLKKPVEKSHFDRVAPECSSDATLASAGDNANSSTGYNLRKTHSYKYQPADVLVRTSHGSHGSDAWMSEWENEFPASVLKAVIKYGKKPYAVDENKRDTYKNSLDSMNGPSNLNIFEGELKQLIAVGIHSEHGYAKSLARFTADLGPAVWRIASKKIESVLPRGIKYGPGWVGDDMVIEGQQQFQFSNRLKVSSNSLPNHPSGSLQFPNSTGSNSAFRSNSLVWVGDMETAGSLSQCKFSGSNPMSSVPVQQNPVIQSDINGFSYNNHSHLMGTARPGTQTGKSSTEAFGMVSTSNINFSTVPGNDSSQNKAKFSENSSGLQRNGLSALDSSQQPEFIQYPPNLNIGFLGPHFPSSSMPMGSPQQPDLVLQL